jgi:ABC-type nickel/cobalt efflux system permease component RcnA
MGNFSINHFSALEISTDRIQVSYIIDMAEIPTFQEMQAQGLTAQPSDTRVADYRECKVRELQQGLVLQVDEQTLPLSIRTSSLMFPPGTGGLPTLRISAVYEAHLGTTSGRLVYEDHNYLQRVGWKEIIATASNRVALTDLSVPTVSKSNQLTTYAADLLQAPPQDLSVSLSFKMLAPYQTVSAASAERVLPVPETAQTPRSALAELLTAEQLSVGVIVFSLLVALGLGAFHALEPGHGKTLVAAYLIGSRGTAWHALLLGLTVTASHTIGVYAMGGIALFASHYILPEQLYPWLGLASGVLIAGVGVVLLKRTWLRYQEQHEAHHHHHPWHDHDHVHDHRHHHHDHPHEHQHDGHHSHSHQGSEVSYKALLTLGITGGMIPCPAALVVLLSAVALQRITFGLLLIIAFSAGLAAVLVGTGLLLVSVRGMVQRWSGEGPWLTYLPFLSPLVITPLGIVIALRSLIGADIPIGLPF